MLRMHTVRDKIYKETYPTNYNRFRLLFGEAASESLLDEEVVNRQLSATALQLLRHLLDCFSM